MVEPHKPTYSNAIDYTRMTIKAFEFLLERQIGSTQEVYVRVVDGLKENGVERPLAPYVAKVAISGVLFGRAAFGFGDGVRDTFREVAEGLVEKVDGATNGQVTQNFIDGFQRKAVKYYTDNKEVLRIQAEQLRDKKQVEYFPKHLFPERAG